MNDTTLFQRLAREMVIVFLYYYAPMRTSFGRFFKRIAPKSREKFPAILSNFFDSIQINLNNSLLLLFFIYVMMHTIIIPCCHFLPLTVNFWTYLLLVLFLLINILILFWNYKTWLISRARLYMYNIKKSHIFFFLYVFSLEARNLFEEQFMLFAERIWTRNKMGVFMWKGIHTWTWSRRNLIKSFVRREF